MAKKDDEKVMKEKKHREGRHQQRRGRTLKEETASRNSDTKVTTGPRKPAGYLLLLTKLNGFCIMSSIGAMLSLSSTCFLMGPVGQCKKMFDESRWLASLFYVGFIALALIAGLVLQNAPLALISIAGQYVAMAWYSLSYIPYAR
ncbi:unnamed protein product [Heligmosomoides polygyrus]|uniref:Vesicle transport protein n=1 Tax=Heligmosomoides polygyrus TaxID=6339 RepID=A0A183FF59_HELPZ|nr:unnamed protein product [Heligmosomoides polygyrus]